MEMNGDPMLQANAPPKEFSTERCLRCSWEREVGTTEPGTVQIP